MKQLVNKPPTKAQLREQLRRDVRDFLDKGGNVEKVARGISGRDHNVPLPRVFFDQARTERTPVTDLIGAIEARRKPQSRQKPLVKAVKPRLKTLYDDFGEPVRRVWVDD